MRENRFATGKICHKKDKRGEAHDALGQKMRQETITGWSGQGVATEMERRRSLTRRKNREVVSSRA